MVITIGSVATLRTIEEFREVLLDAFTTEQSIEVDGSEVIEADLSLVQVLEAAARQATAADRVFRVLPNASPALTEVVALAGISGRSTGGWAIFVQAGDHSR